jgi:hypothetical protein
MRNFKIKIAGYIIGFKASADGPDLAVSPKFLRNIIHETEYDVLIKVHSGTFKLPIEAERVFHAPFVEEINGILVHNNPEFWSVWRYNSNLYIKTKFPVSDYPESAVLKFSLTGSEWDLWMETYRNEIDPLEYPLDGLILYYLTVINNDIMTHASGVNYAGKGLLFSGISGKGKTTMARLWDNHGARVIHDDRLVIRKSGNGYMMFNTPVYNNDEPLDSPLDRIFIIEHGNENRMVPLKEAAAVSQVMANCIQHSWGQTIISKLLESVSEICRTIPTYKLFFRPDSSIIDHILNKYE